MKSRAEGGLGGSEAKEDAAGSMVEKILGTEGFQDLHRDGIKKLHSVILQGIHDYSKVSERPRWFQNFS